MATLAPSRNLYTFFRKGYAVLDFGKRIFNSNFYYSTTAYYKAILSQYVNFDNYIDIYQDTLKLSSIQTSTDIQSNALGVHATKVIEKYGKPDFIFKENALMVFVYKWKFNGLKTRCEIHLYNQKAFLVNHIYNQLDKNERNYVVNAIREKYLNQYMNEIDMVKSKISDRNNNVVFMDDFMMGLKVTYMANCESDWYEAMIGEVNDKRARHAARIKIGEKRFYSSI